MLSEPSVAVIIPTTCEAVRADALLRAIRSVLGQEGVEIQLLLIVNGSRYDPDLLEQVGRNPDFSTIRLAEPSLPIARAHGRSLVRAQYFGFLDDDDELLPGALRMRCNSMMDDPGVDFVVTNGYRYEEDHPHTQHVDQILADPVAALLEQNWLASCGGLYRSSSIHQNYFDDMPPYLEWTALAFRLLLEGKRLTYLNECTFRVHDSPVSLSKSGSYHEATARVMADMLRLKMPRHVRAKLRQMLADGRHDLSVASLKQGRRLQAWGYHLQSLAGTSGLKYLPYTRHLFF